MCSCKIATTIFFELPADDISHLYFLLTAIVSRKLEVTKHQEIYTHFLNSNFVFSKIFSCEDLSMATQAKKMKYRTKYSDELKKQFSFVTKCFSSISDHQYKFHWNICNLDLSCASGGAKDVKKQADTPNHRRNEQSSKRKCIDMALKFKVIPHKLFLKFSNFSKYQWKDKLKKWKNNLVYIKCSYGLPYLEKSSLSGYLLSVFPFRTL